MRQSVDRGEARAELSPVVGKGGEVGFVDLGHLVDGEGERVGDFGHVIDLVERELPALARFQVLVEHLIAADVEFPDRLRNALEALSAADSDGLIRVGIANEFDLVVAPAVVSGEIAAVDVSEEMDFDESPAETRERFKILRLFRKSHTCKVKSQKPGVANTVRGRVQDGVYHAENLFR